VNRARASFRPGPAPVRTSLSPDRTGRASPRGGMARRLRPVPGTRAARWRRVVLRRIVAGLFAAAACWLALGAYSVRGAPPGTSALVVTADLPLGHVLRPDDVATRTLPADAVPAGAVRAPTQAVGVPLAAAVGRGEVLTAVRLRSGGPPLAAGRRAIHVPLADPGAAARLSPGDHIDLVAVADGAVVVEDAVVIDVDRGSVGAFGASESGRGLTVGVPTDRVGPLTAAALGGRGGVHAAVRPAA